MKHVFALVVLACLFTVPCLSQTTTTGNWTLYPPQTATPTNQVTVQQPINPDGTSVWPANKGVVPVQFSLATGTAYGPVIFSSIQSTGSVSYLTFTPTTAMAFEDIKNLTAVYGFTTGNCHGGSLRWKVAFTDGGWFEIYYGNDSAWTDCTTAGATTNQSGLNMINASFDGNGGDPRYETSDHLPSFYTNFANVSTFAAGKTVDYINLILDSGWGGDQVVTLGNVTVNDNTFQPLTSGSLTQTCNLPPANIEVDRLLPTPSGAIDEVATVGQTDSGTQFRIADCHYMYNLAAKSLGVGQYEVKAIINGVPATGSGKFTLK